MPEVSGNGNRSCAKVVAQFLNFRLTLRFVTFLIHKNKSTRSPIPGFRTCPALAIHSGADFCFTPLPQSHYAPKLSYYPAEKENPGHIQPGAVNLPSYKMIIGNREP